MYDILSTEIKQRVYDQKWELLWQIKDHENTYSFLNEDGQRIELVPIKWITVGVYDYLLEMEK